MTISQHYGTKAPGKKRNQLGMTLVEVLVSFCISAFVISGIVVGYLSAMTVTERFSLSQAANMSAMRQLEMVRSAKWDTSSSPTVDMLQSTNFPNMVVVLNVSPDGSRTNFGTNITTISTISTSPPLRRVHVDCVWTYFWSGVLMTNSLETDRGPNQ